MVMNCMYYGEVSGTSIAPIYNGVIITKLDGTSKGGILIAVASETAIPIYYIGVGEKVEDMDTFKAEDFAKGLLDL